ncbi:MFS transporter [Leucobacter massiliensis]|uniref:MFS transporter n=1 Tax=Leucobacter massiliensis TaxID=1686285 RepID=A0A2S9QL47_9MICO|nr:MFS transporter [Leucobacter massiliensis]PRI10311.1 MFS transporter [Leucobacter massiliensis]
MHSPHPEPDRRDTLIARTGIAYFPLALVARLPFAMSVVGVLTLLVSVRGSVELAGLGSAVVGIASAVFGPLIGAAADRFGQRPTLLATAGVNSVALGLLAWTAMSPLPPLAVFAAAFLVGASVPQTSPMSRSRLVTIIRTELPAERRPRTISTVLAYESAADELVFVFGPVIVGLLATTLGAWAPIAGAAALTLLFVTAFALHRTSVSATSPAERAATLAPAAELLRPALLVVVLGIFAVGTVFGSTLTSLTAFMQARGSAESAGLFYGVMGVGSAILAICAALFSPRFTLRMRWLVFASCIVIGEAILASASAPGRGVGTVALGLAITGIGIGPLLVTLYGFGAGRSPEGRSATVMTMLGSGIMLGQSLSAAATGIVAESQGLAAALLLPLCAGAATVLTGAANWLLTPRTAR